MKKRYGTEAAVCFAVCMSAVQFPVSASAAEAAVYVPLNRDGAVYSDQQGTAYASCNDKYYDAWMGSAGSYLAYDLSEAAAGGQIELVWYSGAWGNYDYTVLPESPYASLAAYTIEINKNPGGSYPEYGWELAAAVTGCTTHSGEHVIDFEGYNWVRLTVDETQNGTQVGLNVDIHALNDGVVDSWMFYGDSITACGMTTFGTGNGNFADLLHAIDSRFYPAQQNGGIGGIMSTHGRANIDRWLSQFAGKYVSLAYGTNDCWGNQTGAEKYYENTVYMIEAAQKAGKTVVLPKIPYSLETGVASYVEDYNAMIDRIYAENSAVIEGPDFYAFFKEHPEYLSGDGVHPNEDGYGAMRQLWAETMYEAIYKNRTAESSSLAGDVNGDGSVSLADAVALANYLTAQSSTLPVWKNGDMNGDGKLNAVDLTLLKQSLLGDTDARIAAWLAKGDYQITVDYSAWSGEEIDWSFVASDRTLSYHVDTENRMITAYYPKSDPRTAGGSGENTVTVTITNRANGLKMMETLLTFYPYICDDSGKLILLSDRMLLALTENSSIKFIS